MKDFPTISAPLYLLHSELHVEMLRLRNTHDYLYNPEYLALSAAQQSVSAALEALRAHAYLTAKAAN